MSILTNLRIPIAIQVMYEHYVYSKTAHYTICIYENGTDMIQKVGNSSCPTSKLTATRPCAAFHMPCTKPRSSLNKYYSLDDPLLCLFYNFKMELVYIIKDLLGCKPIKYKLTAEPPDVHYYQFLSIVYIVLANTCNSRNMRDFLHNFGCHNHRY
jgi:hypothetical protein